MALLELIIAETVVSGSICLGLNKMDELAQRQDALMKWEIDGKSTPVLDGWLESMAGTPETDGETKISSRIVDIARMIVNRKAFEHVVHGLVNRNSGLLERFPFLRKLRDGASESAGASKLSQVWTGISSAIETF